MFDRPKSLEQTLRDRLTDCEKQIEKLSSENQRQELSEDARKIGILFALSPVMHHVEIQKSLEKLHNKLNPGCKKSCPHDYVVEPITPKNPKQLSPSFLRFYDGRPEVILTEDDIAQVKNRPVSPSRG